MAHSNMPVLESLTALSLENLGVGAESHLLCAVSGGADSMTMAAVLHSLYRSGSFASLGLVHIDHQLRGQESEQDELLIRKFARQRSLPLFIKHCDTQARAENDHTSIEIAARDIRYEFFEMLFRHTSAAFLITAHTANDNLETVLINMIRGTGLRGLRGIPPKREIIQEKYVIRPWLDIEREDILEYQTTYSIPFRYDSSNAEFEFLRNRIRHTVIPALVNSFPDRNIYDGFRRTVRIISENIEEQIDTALFDLSLTAIPLEDDYIERERVGIAAEFIESIGPVRRRELLYQIFTIGMGIPDAPHLDSTQMLLVNMFIDTPEKKELLLREDIIFYRQALTRTEYPEIDIIVIEWIRRESISDTMYLLPSTDKPLKTKIGELSSRIVSVKDVHFINGNAYFDAQAIGNRKIFLREWKEGDRIQPFGMNGHSKLVSDLLNEAGVPSYLKTLCLVAVLEDDEELIIWLPGIRAADLAPVTNSTETVLVLERKPIQKQDHDGLNEADDDNVF